LGNRSEGDGERTPESPLVTEKSNNRQDPIDFVAGPPLDTNLIPAFTREPVLLQFEIEVDPEEGHYINFFLTKIKHTLPYFEAFPAMAGEVFNRAITHPALLQTVLSVSHLVADCRLHRSLFHAFNYQSKALRLLQQSISAVDITEGVAVAVALLVWINLCQANISAMGKHLGGLYLIFKEVQRRQLTGSTPSSLLLQMWRFTVRLDWIATIIFFPRKPVFPHVLLSKYNNDGQWVRLSTPSEKAVEWTLTSFALDSLIHRACHVACHAHDSRKSPTEDTEPQIQQWTTQLFQEHQQWSRRQIILEAEAFEQEADLQLNAFLPPTTQPTQFFNHEPIRVYNIYYGNMRNCWRAIYILIDLIANPTYGPIDPTSQRYLHAIEICRVYHSLGTRGQIFPFGKVPSVFLAGIGLGGKTRSQDEGNWLYDHAVTEMTVAFPLKSKALVWLFWCRVLMLVFVFEFMGGGGELLGCAGDVEYYACESGGGGGVGVDHR
jgi:hypothetical protein